jgi:hypothetical protein
MRWISTTLLGGAAGVALAVVFVVSFLPWQAEDAAILVQHIEEIHVDPGLDRCAACHQRVTPGIVDQWAESVHARRGVTCRSCHVVDEDNPLGQPHVGRQVASIVTPRVCGECHANAVQEFARSGHSLPAWASLTGTRDFEDNPTLMALWNRWGDESLLAERRILQTRTSLHDIEGPEITALACAQCHAIGRPNLDGSAGSCSKCHLRHRFNLEQVRRPETCNTCHTGPDQPQWEIFHESPHGVIYRTQEHLFHFGQMAGRLRVDDFPAPTCQICHMSGFGSQPTTHDVGERLSWHLATPVALPRDDHEERRDAMRDICRQCHSTEFIDQQFRSADAVVSWTNSRVQEAETIVRELMEEGLVSPEPFSHPIQHLAFEIWHYSGRTARFGAFMQGADYMQWHGIYPMLRGLTELRAAAARLRSEAGHQVSEGAGK